MKTRVAQGHCVLLEQNKKILREAFSLCSPAHCNTLCTPPSINNQKNSSNHKSTTAHMRSVMTPDQILLLPEDKRHLEKYPALPVKQLWVYMRANQSRIQPIVFCFFLVCQTQKTTAIICVQAAAPNQAIVKVCPILRTRDWHFEVSPVRHKKVQATFKNAGLRMTLLNSC